MRRALSRFVMILLLSIIPSSMALAETIKQEITFWKPVVVNGTEIKKGTYVATFDDQTNELTIAKGKKVIVKTPARLEKRSLGKNVAFIMHEDGDQSVLVSVSFKNDQVTILNNEAKATGAP